MDLHEIVFTALLAGSASWLIVKPFFVVEEKGEVGTVDVSSERIYDFLAELEHDYLAEKISEDDYQQTKSELLSQLEEMEREHEAPNA